MVGRYLSYSAMIRPCNHLVGACGTVRHAPARAPIAAYASVGHKAGLSLPYPAPRFGPRPPMFAARRNRHHKNAPLCGTMCIPHV